MFFKCPYGKTTASDTAIEKNIFKILKECFLYILNGVILQAI